MDRNTIIGLMLIFGLLIGFSYINRPSQEQIEAAQRRQDSLALVEAERLRELRAQELLLEQQRTAADTLALQQQKERLGVLGQALVGERRMITLENELIRIQVSTQGGHIHSAELKGYQTYAGEPLVLFGHELNRFGLEFWGHNNHVQTQALHFTPSTPDTLVDVSRAAEPYTLTMRLQAGDGAFLDYIYTIHPNSYQVDLTMRFTGMNTIITDRLGAINLLWDMYMPQLEKGVDNESNYTTIAFRYPNGDFEQLKATGDQAKESITTKLHWIGYKHQFFSTFLVSDQHFLNAQMESFRLADGEHTKRFQSQIALPFENAPAEEINLKLFFVPNHYNTLRDLGYAFEDVIPLGGWIIQWINRYVVILIFDLLDNHVANYGVIILLLTIIIKIVLFPLTYKSYVSQAKMRVLKPQMDELTAKYPKKEDAMKKQQAVMALYKKAGVNPLGGCLPMLIQLPILIAMFRFFPASFELRQQSFLWADDLSAYDSILSLPFNIPFYGDHVSLFTLLMAVSLYFTSRLSMAQMADTSAQLPGMKFMMLYMMPIMLLFWFNSYSSGLSYYYLLTNLITLGQTYLIRLTINDEAILKKLNENAKKPVKKSKFQEKIEEWTAKQRSEAKLNENAKKPIKKSTFQENNERMAKPRPQQQQGKAKRR